MDYYIQLKQLSEKVRCLKETTQTEEATKMAFVAPFLKALGYDVFDPHEVVPEYTCDIGTKKGEKIDYAIFKNGEPIILIECKHCKQKLNLHEGQLLRYFHVSKAKFAILTNGIEYLFYSDLAEPNRMDEKPFLEINLENLKDTDIAIEAVKKFHKSCFAVDTISREALEWKYMRELKTVINSEISKPSENFVKALAKQIYSGTISQKWLEIFTDLTKRAFSQVINDIISERLILTGRDEIKPLVNADEIKPIEELESDGFKIVKTILNQYADRLHCVNRANYISIKLDGKKTICRLWLKSSGKYIDIPEDGKRNMVKIKNLSDINSHSENLLKMVVKHEK